MDKKFYKWWETIQKKTTCDEAEMASKSPSATSLDNKLTQFGLALPSSGQPYDYCGLVNLGLTCYVNSCLQALYTAPPIRSYLIDHLEKGPFHNALSKLFLHMETESARLVKPSIGSISIKPDAFLEQWRQFKPTFLGNTMHDSQEFLSLLIDTLHQEANQANRPNTRIAPAGEKPAKSAAEAWSLHVCEMDNSYLSSLMMGQLESTLRCLTCGHVSHSWTAIWQLQLQLEKEESHSTAVLGSKERKEEEAKFLTLKECFKEYTEDEVSRSCIRRVNCTPKVFSVALISADSQ